MTSLNELAESTYVQVFICLYTMCGKENEAFASLQILKVEISTSSVSLY